MELLGLSTGPPGSAAALVRDGRVVVATAEDRLTRQRHDPSYPRFAAELCLAEAEHAASALDAVAVCGDPADQFTRVLVGSLGAGFPSGAPAFVRNMKAWVGHRLWARDEVSRRLDVHPAHVVFVPRHRALAAQAAQGHDDAAVLVLDDLGEWACAAIFGPGLREVETIDYPHSLGLVTAAFAALLGFRPWQDRGELRDLAAYGRPVFASRMRRVVRVQPDGTYRVDPTFFRFAELFEPPYGAPWTPALTELFGAPRDPRRPLPFGASAVAADPEDQRAADVAASLRVVVEEAVVALARRAAALTGARHLRLAGAMAVDAGLVARVRGEGIFDTVSAPPDPAAGAVGAALWVQAERGGAPDDRPLSPYLGRAWDETRDVRSLAHADPVYWQRFRRRGCRPVRDATLDVREGLDDDVVAGLACDDLAEGRVVGWARGRSEVGPRALGRRAILAAPGDPEAARRLRERVTGRPDWRPLGLAVAEEDAARVADIAGPDWWTPVPYPVRPEVRERVRSGVHVDGTVRVLVVSAARDPGLHALLRAWGARTGLAALLHHGLQEGDEPLAASPADALIVFMRTEMDTLVLGQSVVRKVYA